jgi:hypothetical protein
MVKRLMMVLLIGGALACGSFGIVALAQAGGGTAESGQESTAPENSATDPDNVQYTAPGDADHAAAGATAARKQHARRQATRHVTRSTTRHTTRHATRQAAGGEQPGEQESSVETEAGQPGEPANGHQDASGTAQHECTGDCVE